MFTGLSCAVFPMIGARSSVSPIYNWRVGAYGTLNVPNTHHGHSTRNITAKAANNETSRPAHKTSLNDGILRVISPGLPANL